MIATLPDNEINKELKARLHNLEVGADLVLFKFFVSRVTNEKLKNYILVNTQLNQSDTTKCGKGWINSTEIQIVTILPKNSGSKALMNEATNDVIQELKDFALPLSAGIKVSLVDLDVENELVEETGSEIVYRKILRMETRIT